MSARTVTSVGIARVSMREDKCKPIFVDAPVAPQNVDDRDRHLGVVGRLPPWSRKASSLDRFRVEEQALAERVTDREARESRVRSFQSLGGGIRDVTG